MSKNDVIPQIGRSTFWQTIKARCFRKDEGSGEGDNAFCLAGSILASTANPQISHGIDQTSTFGRRLMTSARYLSLVSCALWINMVHALE